MTQALLSQFLIGFSVAAILVISAIGLAVIFGVAGVINMAHGQFIMVGAYTAAVVGQIGATHSGRYPPRLLSWRCWA